jgi:antitoxin component HigA of HigAB toxin-antitoxin module
MTIKSRLSLPADAPETYEELAMIYVPRKIHDKIGQRNATEVVDWLAIRAKTKDQVEFLDLVSDLLDEYECQFSKIDNSSDPLELLQYLVEENRITARELSEILNVDHSVAARILKGQRGITVEHAKNLGARFKVDPKVFLKL